MSNSNWWANKLGNSSPGPRSDMPATRPPARTSVSVTGTQAHRLPVQYDQEEDTLTTKAQHVRKSSSCPECGSGNYMIMNGNYSRCYDCGYPVVQSGSGMPTSTSTAPVRAAKQVSTSNNYNPGHIVGRVE